MDEERKGAMSRNHIMFGEISAWFYKALGGSNPIMHPGFKNILLQPHFVKGLKDLKPNSTDPLARFSVAGKKRMERFFTM